MFRRRHPRPAARAQAPLAPGAVAHPLERRLLLADFTVTSTADAGPGTLRQAILDANASPQVDIIRFNLGPLVGPTPVFTIRPATPLPDVVAETFIDGRTQPGYANGRPMIELSGDGAGAGATGLHLLNASNSGISGLIINRWSGNGVWIDGGSRQLLQNNWIGVTSDAAAPAAAPNGTGVYVRASLCRIGTGTAAQKNVISGNVVGVRIGRDEPLAPNDDDDNVVSANYIGTTPDGAAALGNTSHGVLVAGGNSRTVVRGNLVSANGQGITFEVRPSPSAQATPARDARVEGNTIGLGTAGTALGNGAGVFVSDGAVMIGGVPGTPPALALRNVISGNATGVRVVGGTVAIVGNHIGTDFLGAEPRPNGVGVLVESAAGTTIGGTVAAARNLLAGNTAAAVRFARAAVEPLPAGASPHRVLGNYFGIHYLGVLPLRNGGPAVELVNATGVVVGGDDDASRNILSGSTDGVRINGATGTRVLGNYIGTDYRGRIDALNNTGNSGSGVNISGFAVGNAVERNLITFNGGNGILVNSGNGNTFLNNSIYNNGRLAIDLGADGITPNDPKDLDTGPNDRQNFPLLATAQIVLGQTVVTGTVSGPPGVFAYRVQFFYGPAPSSSFFTEGKTFLGEATVTTGADGTADFTATLPPVTPGQVITATATWPGTATRPAQTSEFSRGVPVAPPDTQGPRISWAYVSGSQWTPAFYSHVTAGPWNEFAGYPLQTGAAQSMPLPWSNLDTIRIHFDEPVEVHADDLMVHASVGDGGAAPGRYGFASFTYADQVATWRLNRPIGNDRILLELKSAGVHDSVGNALDGEFTGRTTTGTGTPGGDFLYHFSVQPGHVTRWFATSVTAMDRAQVLRRYGSSIGSGGTPSPRYWMFADINGDGRINATDLLLTRTNQRRPLPEPPPAI